MKRFRRLFVCLLCVSLLSTTLVTQFQSSAKGKGEPSGSLVRKESGDSFLRFREGIGFESGLSSPALFGALPQREQVKLPPIMVWTSLRQRDFEACLPPGATVRAVGREGYVISNLTDYISFTVHLSIQSGRLRNEVPRFSRPGARDPGPPDAQYKELLIKVAEILVNIIFRPPWPADGDKFPEGPLPDPEKIRKLLPNGWDPNGPVPQPFGQGGFWILECTPKPPCVRPEEPTPETVPDCKKEQDEVDRLLAKIVFLESEIAKGQELVDILLKIKAGLDIVDHAAAAMTLIAGLTAPIATTAGAATMAIAGGAAGITAGLAIVALPLAIYAISQLLDLTILNPIINYLKRQIAEIQRMLASYKRGLKDALDELAACKKKAAEAKQRNTDAFQNYINVLLPRFYDCLQQRKCRRRWVPK